MLSLLATACTAPPGPPAAPTIPTAAATATEHGVQICDAPQRRREVAYDRLESGDWADRPPSGTAWGLAVADFDEDGWLDIVLPSIDGVRLYEGSASGLVRADPDAMPEATRTPGWKVGAAADFDGDGQLDVYLGGGDRSLWLTGRGDGTFAAARSDRGPTYGAAFGDLDGDGDLDAVVANGGGTDSPGIYENAGGALVPQHSWAPPGFFEGLTFGVGIVDLNQDMRPELYKVNDIASRTGNALLWNRGGGAFEADGGEAGLDIEICSMGLGLGDLNGDAIPDLAISDCDDLWLFESSAAGRFVDASAARDLRTYPDTDRTVPWGVEMGDLDNDGDLDVYVGYGFFRSEDWPMPRHQPDGIYENVDGAFVEVAAAWGVDDLGTTRGFALADLDNNGWLDIVKPDVRTGRPHLYLARCGEAAWARVALRQPGPNTRAVGAQVRFVTSENAQTRWVFAGGTSVGSGGPNEVHAGLGDAETVDVEVVWPDGARTTHGPFETRQRIQIVRGVP